MPMLVKNSRVSKNYCAAHLLRCGPPGVLTYCLVRSARQAPPRLASGLARDVFQHPAGRALFSGQRGQAMLEYSVLNWLLIVALVLGCTVRVIPGPERKKNLIELFFNAFQVQYDSYYFLLNSALP